MLGFALAIAVSGCGPDKKQCTGPHPDFVVLLELMNRPLPPDIVVHVTYGGSGMEDFSLARATNHEVVFCRVASADGGVVADAGSDAGAAEAPAEVEAISCELWTGGYAKIEVSAATVPSVQYDLAPREQQCTVSQTLVLDRPDAG